MHPHPRKIYTKLIEDLPIRNCLKTSTSISLRSNFKAKKIQGLTSLQIDMSLTSTVSPGIGMDIDSFLTDFFLSSHTACECMKPVLFLILSFTKRGKKLPQPFHYVFSKILMRQASYNNPKIPKLVSKSGNVIHKLANCGRVVLDVSQFISKRVLRLS